MERLDDPLADRLWLLLGERETEVDCETEIELLALPDADRDSLDEGEALLEREAEPLGLSEGSIGIGGLL